MRRMRLKTLLLTIVALTTTALSASAADFTSAYIDNVLYYLYSSDKTATVVGPNDAFSGTSLTIPATVTSGGDTYTVTKIGTGNNPLINSSSITEVTIQAAATISKNAFTNWGLKTVNLSNKVTGIDIIAFYNCRSLKTVTGTNAVTTIGERAFQFCSSLESFTGTAVTQTGKTPFQGCSAMKYLVLNNSSLQVTDNNTGSSTTTISRNYFFASNSGITNTSCVIYVNANATVAANQYNVVAGTTCADFRLTEGTSYDGPGSDYNFTAEKVTYARSLAADKVYTICVPYQLPAIDGVTYYVAKTNSLSGTTFDFTEISADKTAANRPYLVVTTKAVSNFNITSGSTAIAANSTQTSILLGGGYEFNGTSVKLSPAETVGKYILQEDNKWQKAVTENDAVYVPPFRAYIKPGTGLAPALSMTLDGEGTTAVENIRTIDADGTEQWYDLSGRRIAQPAKKGIYIINGKKVVR